MENHSCVSTVNLFPTIRGKHRYHVMVDKRFIAETNFRDNTTERWIVVASGYQKYFSHYFSCPSNFESGANFLISSIQPVLNFLIKMNALKSHNSMILIYSQ